MYEPNCNIFASGVSNPSQIITVIYLFTYLLGGSVVQWLRSWTYDSKVACSIPGHGRYCILSVTVFGRANHLSISPSQPGQLGLLPSAGREMSTGQSAATLCGWGVKAWLITCGCMCWWQVKLCDPSLTRANLSALEMSIARIGKRHTNVLFTCLFTCVKNRAPRHSRVRSKAPITSSTATTAAASVVHRRHT